MSQSQSEGGGYRAALAESYAAARRKAKEALNHSVSQSLETCENDQNLLLVLFLQEARDVMQAKGNENIAKAYGRGAKMLRRHPLRVYNKDRLLEVNGFGPATSNAVEKYLWSDPECCPAPPRPEELEAEQRHFEAKRQQELKQKAAEKQKKADERAAKKLAQQAAGQPILSQQSRSQMPFQASAPLPQQQPENSKGNNNSLSGRAREDQGVQQPKRQRTSVAKERIPGVGTAKYGFLIALFQAHRNGEPCLTKHELINRTEALHITSKPIQGNPNAPTGPGKFAYDGWSSFSQLVNKDPPLAQVYSNPKKCRLTPEGEQLAKRLYLDAVERQSIPADQGILDYIRRTASNDAEGLSFAATVGAAPSALRTSNGSANTARGRIAVQNTVASAALRQDSLACQGAPLTSISQKDASAGRQHVHPPQHQKSGQGEPGLSTRMRNRPREDEDWDFSDEEQAAGPSCLRTRCPSRGLGSVKDSDVAQLMEMGFTPEQASRGLAGGRTVPEAVEVITIDLSDSDEEQQEREAPPLSQVGSQRIPSFQQAPRAVPLPAQGPASAPAAATGRGRTSGAAAHPLSTVQLQQPSSAPTALPHRAPMAKPVGQAASLLPPVSCISASQASSVQARDPGSLSALLGEGRQHHSQYRLQAAWRLKGIAEGGSAEEQDIRLPPLAAGERFDDRYEVCLVLDTRERFGNQMRSAVGGGHIANKNAEAVRQLSALGITVLTKSIEAGDALWVARPRRGGQSYALDTIIERKRVDDLVSSIRDQRYERQRYFLARCGMRRTMYLLEGDIDLTTQGPMAKACKTALHRLEVEDGFRVLRTPDSTHTFRLYKRITSALQAKYARLQVDSPNVATGGEHLPTLEGLEERLRLAKQVTLRDVWGLMLCTVPRISSENCEAILQEFPTPISLWRAYDAVIREALAKGEHALAAANKMLTRLPRIGPDTSRLVFCSLFANGWQVA